MPGLHVGMNDIKDYGESLNQLGCQWYVGLDPRVNLNEAAYMSDMFQRPVLAVNEGKFLKSDDNMAHDALICIKNKKVPY